MTNPISEKLFLDYLIRSAGEDDEVELSVDAFNDDFEDLGIDSLAVMECVALIKRETETDLPTDIIDGADTPAELLTLINRHVTNEVAAGLG